MRGYPEKFIRGILNKTPQWLVELDPNLPNSESVVTAALFNEFKNKDPLRPDNFAELSIVWYDNEDAIDQLFRHTKNDNLVYLGGACLLSTRKLSEALEEQIVFRQYIRYERDPIPGNPSHGNLLMDNAIRKELKMTVFTHLANHIFIKVEPNPHVVSNNPANSH